MTQEQFDNHAWRKSDRVVYKGVEYPAIMVVFSDGSIGILIDDCRLRWIHHSEIELVNKLEK